MQSPVFFGQYELVLDEKSRLLVPSDVRKRVLEEHGDAFFLVIGTYNKVPWLYPDRYYEALATQGRQTILPDRETAEFYRMTFAMASRLPVDKQGRILVPARTLDRTLIKDQKDLVLVGAYDHLELWPAADWEIEQESLLKRSSEIATRARESGQLT